MPDNKQAALRDLKTIPGVGKSVAEDLWSLGIRRVTDLKGRDPQALYDELRIAAGGKLDRCMLYTLRCAVYYATNAKHEPEKLKWWNWKDGG
ncbi:MAG: helix-hairpin-helix domain-containing protein [Sulfuricella sp.]|nr:helix-hairpin-helix domain-containing protein [Sulfuricella sp.]